MERIQIDEFVNFQFLSNLQLSPNGEKAAFVVSKSNEERNGYAAGIWVLDLKTKTYRRLTAGKDERSYLWLDDNAILFASRRESKKEEVDRYSTDYFEISLCGGEAEKKMTVAAPVQEIKKISDNLYLLNVEYDNNLPADFFEKSREERRAVLKNRE